MMSQVLSKQLGRGYVLVLAALLIAIFAFTGIAVVGVAKQTQQQLHVQKAADYAADAAGIIAARDLNFKAVTNRAMLANEVVIGQLLGLSSWLSMTTKTLENAALVSSWVPYLGAIARSVSQTARTLDSAVQKGLPALIRVQQGVLVALEKAQVVVHTSSWVNTLTSIENIIQHNNPHYELALLNHASLQSLEQVWLKFQSRRSDSAQQVEYVALVADSRDPFSQSRGYSWFNAGVAKVEKRGASEIQQERGQVFWQAIDVTGLNLNLWLYKKEISFGWGANYTMKPLPRRVTGALYGNSYRHLPRTSRRAASTAVNFLGAHQVPQQYRLQAGADLPRITLVVRQRENEAEGRVQLWGVGRSELVYSRPRKWWPRADQAVEQANLFNALWRRQKAPVTADELEVLRWQL